MGDRLLHRTEAARLAGYLFNAVLAGRATPRHWQSWADRMIEAGELDVWILDVSVAKSVDQLRTALAPFYPIEYDCDAVIGHLWQMYLDGEFTFNGLLTSVVTGEATSARRGQFELLLWYLDEGPEFEYVRPDDVAKIVTEEGLAERAHEQWGTLFPDGSL